MLTGVGVDIVRIDRFRTWLVDSKKLARFFHSSEIEYCLAQHNASASFAARFAAREALLKAAGNRFASTSPIDVWVERDQDGAPYFQLSDNLKDQLGENSAILQSSIHLSLSHDGNYAIAFVVIESNGSSNELGT